MGIISSLIEAIKGAFRFLVNIVRKVIQGIFQFAKQVVGWFRSLTLDREKHTPFIADAQEFKEMLKTAPKKDVGIFEGVYDEEADEIVANRYIEADKLDQKTKEVLGNEPLVVLS